MDDVRRPLKLQHDALGSIASADKSDAKASRNLTEPVATTAQIDDAARYFRKLVRVVKWLLITETKHRRDN